MPENINNIHGIRGPSHAERIKKGLNTPQTPETSFQDILGQEQLKQGEDLKFSVHAQNRIQERNITLSSEDRMKLQMGIDKILEKGGKESLIIMEDNAFVVSAPNRTVITAIDSQGLQENVFTNIDSALVIK